MDDADKRVRLAAVEALASLDGEAARPFLVRALKDADPGIRRAAAEGLGRD